MFICICARFHWFYKKKKHIKAHSYSFIVDITHLNHSKNILETSSDRPEGKRHIKSAAVTLVLHVLRNQMTFRVQIIQQKDP